MTEIDDLLNADPLGEAEALTGESYKESEDTLALGMLLHMVKGDAVREEMGLRDDTFYGSSFEDALRVLAELGFEVIHQHEFFPKSYGSEEPRTEQYIVLWRDGVLATLVSYNGTSVNNLELFYNWQPNEDVRHSPSGASGHLHGESYDQGVKIWIGHQDARTGLRHILNRLETTGKFLTSWIESPFLYLMDYALEAAGADYKVVTAEVISTFPTEVREALGS